MQIQPAEMIMQVDADKEAYAYANLERPQEVNEAGILRYFERLRRAAGVKKLNLHVSLGNKGGREVISTVKQYQGNRVGMIEPEKRQLISALREFISNINTPELQGVTWRRQEADDGMVQMQHLSYNSVICSQDKDLRMAEGWHYTAKTNEYWYTDAFGELRVDEKESGAGKVTKKVWGCGTMWFWCQMLQGDTVDNVPGLEMMSVDTANKYFPIKNTKGRKPKKCGALTAYGILLGARNDKECFDRVHEAYKGTYGLTGDERFFEQAVLLWMRRNETALDVLAFLEPLGFDYIVKPDLLERLKEWI